MEGFSRRGGSGSRGAQYPANPMSVVAGLPGSCGSLARIFLFRIVTEGPCHRR
jgi:hypothetical protein